jgi:transcription initiation factor TFIIB
LNPIKIVSHYAKNLKIKRRTLKKAVSIIEKAKEEGANSGKDPFSTAATATYLACLAENEKITQEEISNVFGVTSVTIRNNSKKLKKFIKQK